MVILHIGLMVVISFQEKFDVKDFVGHISEKLIAQSKADPGRKQCLTHSFSPAESSMCMT